MISTEHINRFDGCQYGKTIEFASGSSITCIRFGTQYAYSVAATILAKGGYHEGQHVIACKMIVQDKIYDMECGSFIEGWVGALRKYISTAENSAYAAQVLATFVAALLVP